VILTTLSKFTLILLCNTPFKPLQFSYGIFFSEMFIVRNIKGYFLHILYISIESNLENFVEAKSL